MRCDRPSAVLIVAAALVSAAAATDKSPWTVAAHPKKCVGGLHRQPAGGEFAAILFCDDAAGSSLGVVCYSGNACDQQPWQLANRFWQDESWARDVTGFGWDPDGRCLYVSTSETYGDGRLFALDLRTKTATPVVAKLHGQPATSSRPSTEIIAVNPAKGYLDYKVHYFDAARDHPTSELVSVPLGRCGQK
jgi:hypothetical protein